MLLKVSNTSNQVWLISGTSWYCYVWNGTSWERAQIYDRRGDAPLAITNDGTSAYGVDSRDVRNILNFSNRTFELSNGSITNPLIRNNINLAGLWTEGSAGKLNILFSAFKTDYLNTNALDSAIVSLLKSFTFTFGDNTYTYEIPATGFSNKMGFSDADEVFIRYEIPDFTTSQVLKDIVLEDSLFGGATINLEFTQKALTAYQENSIDVTPQTFSAVYSGFDEAGVAKELQVGDVNLNAILSLVQNREQISSFFFNSASFQEIKGTIATNKYYYIATSDNPLAINSEVLSFFDVKDSLFYRYPLIDVVPSVSAQQLLSARVYNYKTRFKWLDENGLEHRSQFSDVMQIISNTAVGVAGNQPTFSLNCFEFDK